MPPRLVLFSYLAVAVWLMRRDTRGNANISSALWIPTIWALIALSRPLSFWLGMGGGSSTLEGSPLDSTTYMVLIALALRTLARRNFKWGSVIQANWPVFLFYGYLLLTVLWSDHSFVSTKRWFKEFGNVIVALVMLTEAAPEEAIRTVFLRCAYLTIPLSIVTIRYFPSIGRVYNVHSGDMEAVGVTDQKNSLGAMVLVCSIVLAWEWLERTKTSKPRESRIWNRKYVPLLLIAGGGWLLHACNSKTSTTLYIFAIVVLFSLKFRAMRVRVGGLVPFVLTATVAFLVLDEAFGLKDAFLRFIGRDATLTGRTNVWQALLGAGTDPVFGTGFCSFWDNATYMARMPEWVRTSAHNAYLEVYLDGGTIGTSLLVIMLIVAAARVHQQVRAFPGSPFAVVRFVTLFVITVAGFSESTFVRMGALAFLFLATAIDPRWKKLPSRQPQPRGIAWPNIPTRDAAT